MPLSFIFICTYDVSIKYLFYKTYWFDCFYDCIVQVPHMNLSSQLLMFCTLHLDVEQVSRCILKIRLFKSILFLESKNNENVSTFHITSFEKKKIVT